MFVPTPCRDETFYPCPYPMGEFGPTNPELSLFIREMEALLPTIDDAHATHVKASELGERDMHVWRGFMDLVRTDIETIVSDISLFRSRVAIVIAEAKKYKPDKGSSSQQLVGMINNDLTVLESECEFYDPDMPEIQGILMVKEKYHL